MNNISILSFLHQKIFFFHTFWQLRKIEQRFITEIVIKNNLIVSNQKNYYCNL